MTPHPLLLLCPLCLGLASQAWAQDDAPQRELSATSEVGERVYDWFFLPLASYSPESSFLLAATTIVSTRDPQVEDALQSSFAGFAMASLNGQLGVGLSNSLYFDRDRWLGEGAVSFVKAQGQYSVRLSRLCSCPLPPG